MLHVHRLGLGLAVWVGFVGAVGVLADPATPSAVSLQQSSSRPPTAARIGRISVKGNRFYSAAFIKRFLEPLQRQGTLRPQALQRALLMLNDYPSLHVKAVLLQGEVPGTTDIELDVSDGSPFHGAIDYNNYGTTFTGQNRAGATLQWGNLLGPGDALLLRGAYPFPAQNAAPFLQGQYTMSLDNAGDQLGFQYATGQFTVGQDLAALNIVGTSNIAGLTFDHPQSRTLSQKTDWSAAFFDKSSNNSILGQPSSNDEIRDLVLGYGGSVFPGHGRALDYSVSLSEGLGTAFGGSANGLATNSRVGAGDSFTKVNANLFTAWRVGGSKYLVLRGSGQYSVGQQPLLIEEQFPLGGPDTVRGFVQGQDLGDSGFALSAELRMPLGTKDDLQGVLFVDAGGSTLYRPQNGEQGFTSLLGAGFGIRTLLFNDSEVRLDLGFPLSSSDPHSGQTPVIYAQMVNHFGGHIGSSLTAPPLPPTPRLKPPPPDVKRPPIPGPHARIGNITVKGNRYYQSQFIEKFMQPVLQAGTLRPEVLQRALLTLNDYPDLHVKAVLLPGATSDTTDLELDVTDTRPFHGAFDYNNFGTAFTGQNRAGLTLQWGNLLEQGDSFLLRGAYPFEAQNPSPFLQGQYTMALNGRGDQLGVQYATGQFTVGQDLAALDIVGTSTIAGVTFDHPSLRTLAQKTDFTAAFYSKSSNETILGQPSSQDEVRELSLGYGGSLFPGHGRALSYSVNLTQGLGTLLGGSQNGLPTNSRVGAGDTFTKLNANVFATRQVGSSAYLVLRGAAQYSGGQPLLITEQFPLGGADTVRGFQQGQDLGDTGFAVSAELRVPLGQKNELQGVLFADTGGSTLYRPQNGEQGFTSLTGAGVGMRAVLFKDSELRLDLGFPVASSDPHSSGSSVLYAQIVNHF